MRDLIISIFGIYTPVTDAAGTPLQGMAGVDWPYLAGVALFGLVLYSSFSGFSGWCLSDDYGRYDSFLHGYANCRLRFPHYPACVLSL